MVLIVSIGTLGQPSSATARSTHPPKSTESEIVAVSNLDLFSVSPVHKVNIEVGPSQYDLEVAQKAELLRQQQVAIEQARQRSLKTLVSISYKNTFVRGQCTWYVASRFPVTWHGDAHSWGANALAQGYLVDKTPEAGAILQTYEHSLHTNLGHVAYIERIVGTTMYLSEMNYVRAGVVSHRTMSVYNPLIAHVIHRI